MSRFTRMNSSIFILCLLAAAHPSYGGFTLDTNVFVAPQESQKPIEEVQENTSKEPRGFKLDTQVFVAPEAPKTEPIAPTESQQAPQRVLRPKARPENLNPNTVVELKPSSAPAENLLSSTPPKPRPQRIQPQALSQTLSQPSPIESTQQSSNSFIGKCFTSPNELAATEKEALAQHLGQPSYDHVLNSWCSGRICSQFKDNQQSYSLSISGLGDLNVDRVCITESGLEANVSKRAAQFGQIRRTVEITPGLRNSLMITVDGHSVEAQPNAIQVPSLTQPYINGNPQIQRLVQ